MARCWLRPATKHSSVDLGNNKISFLSKFATLTWFVLNFRRRHRMLITGTEMLTVVLRDSDLRTTLPSPSFQGFGTGMLVMQHGDWLSFNFIGTKTTRHSSLVRECRACDVVANENS
jgi:hypothetical protein